MSLLERTIQLLQDRPRNMTYADIEDATGLKAPWLSMIHRNLIPEPSVNAIQRLYEFLSDSPLKYE